MTKVSEEKPPYKQVVIMGPDWNGAFEEHRSIDWEDDVLVIGDGQKEVTFDEIREKLTGRINEFTRIDTMAHGGVSNNDPIGTHSIQLSYGSGNVATSSLFRLFNEISLMRPIYIHLWSCYSDNADKEFQYLPEGSIAVFHSNKNTVSYSLKDYDGNLLQAPELQYTEYDNTLNGVKQNLDLSLHYTILTGGGALKFSKSGKTYTVKYVIPEIVDSNKGYLDFIYEYWHVDGKQNLVLASDDIEKDIADFCDAVSHFMKCDEMQELTEQDFMKKIRDIRNNYIMLHFLYNDDLIIVRNVLESRKKENIANAKGTRALTPIFHARSGSAIKLLAEYGADLNYKTRNGYTLLFWKVQENNIELVKALLEAGADPNAIVGNKGRTVLYYAKSPEIIKLLVKHRADLNHKDKNDDTALFCQVQGNNLELARALLEAGADPNAIVGNAGRTALYYAKSPEMIKLLSEYREDLNYKDKVANTTLPNAAKADNLDVVEAIGNQQQTRPAASFPTIDSFQPGQLPANSSSTDDANTQGGTASNGEPHVLPVEVRFDAEAAALIGILAIQAASSAYSSLYKYLSNRFGTLAEPEVQAKLIADIKKLPMVSIDVMQEQILRDRAAVRGSIKALDQDMHRFSESLSRESNPKIRNALEKQAGGLYNQREEKRRLYERLTNLSKSCDIIEIFQKECDEIKKLDNITAKQVSALVKKLDSAQAALDDMLQYEHKHIMTLKAQIGEEIQKLKKGMLKQVKVNQHKLNKEIQGFDKSRLKVTKIKQSNNLNEQFGDHDIKI